MNKWQLESSVIVRRRMGKTGEELAELSSVVSRIQIQGLDAIDPGTGQTNRQRLIDETADVLAQCYSNIKSLDLPQDEIKQRTAVKMTLMDEWEGLYK